MASTRRLTCLVLLAAALGGCVTVTVRTDPPGGIIVRDGQRLGTAPVTFTDGNGVLGHAYSIANPGYVIYSVEAYAGRDLLFRLRPASGGGGPALSPTPSLPGPLPVGPPPPSQPLPAPGPGGDR